MEKTIDECFFQIQNGANIKQGDVDGGYPITRIETTANDKFNRDRMGYAGITDLSKYDVIVDCILGTGFVGDVRGTARDAIEAINKSGAYVISVDIPSGMNGDTGEASLAVISDLTVSIGFIKQGLVTDAAKKYIKALTNVDIGIVLIDGE